MNFQVVVTCTQTPCTKCRASGERAYFLTPVANGVFLDRWRAENDARFCQQTTGADELHRYDVCALREDGWPCCPWCGADELYSLAVPADSAKIDGCYACGRTVVEAAAKHDLTRSWLTTLRAVQ